MIGNKRSRKNDTIKETIIETPSSEIDESKPQKKVMGLEIDVDNIYIFSHGYFLRSKFKKETKEITDESDQESIDVKIKQKKNYLMN